MSSGPLRRNGARPLLIALLVATAAASVAKADDAAAAPAPVTRPVALDVAAGRTGVWLLSQLTRVEGPASAPTLTDVGARLERIDPASGRRIARVELPLAAERLVQGRSGRLWVSGSRLALIDPRTLRASMLGDRCGALIADARPGIWSASICARTLARRSSNGAFSGPPLTLRGPRPAALALGVDGLFIARASSPPTVERRDPRSGRLLGRRRVGGPPDGLVLRGGSLWALGGGAGTLDRLDPVSLQRSARIRLPLRAPGGAHLAVGGGAAWVADQYSGRIIRINPRTERPHARRLAPVPPGTLPVAVATGRRSVWVVVRSDGTRSALCRLDPANGSVERCFPRSA